MNLNESLRIGSIKYKELEDKRLADRADRTRALEEEADRVSGIDLHEVLFVSNISGKKVLCVEVPNSKVILKATDGVSPEIPVSKRRLPTSIVEGSISPVVPIDAITKSLRRKYGVQKQNPNSPQLI